MRELDCKTFKNVIENTFKSFSPYLIKNHKKILGKELSETLPQWFNICFWSFLWELNYFQNKEVDVDKKNEGMMGDFVLWN